MSPLDITWDASPSLQPLGQNEVHVWAVELDRPESVIRILGSNLSPDELLRANRFRFERDRTRFIVGRGTLRVVLGNYMQKPADQLRFEYGARGKPVLAENLPGEDTLHFNVAHSDGLALMAVTRSCPIGIDIERMRHLSDGANLADRFFAPAEAAALRLLPEHLRLQAFYNLWTRKEACLKAMGDGIADTLARIQVTSDPHDPPEVLSFAGESRTAAADWLLLDLHPSPQFKAAFAAPNKKLQLQMALWPSDRDLGS